MFAWMAWTWATAGFFAVILLLLIIMTLLAIYRPETPKRGVLGFPTTRGDRLFVSLIGSAIIFVVWIRITGGDNLYCPTAIALIYGAAMFRFA
jgi:predicted small integral membrane protein